MSLIKEFDKKNLYQRFILKELPLNDQLAAARSILANERTFLSYQRTALALAAAGLTFIKFFELSWIVTIGWIFVPVSVATFIRGLLRYIKMRDLIRNIELECEIAESEEKK